MNNLKTKTIKIKIVGYLDFTTGRIYRNVSKWRRALERIRDRRSKLILSSMLRQAIFEMKIEQAKEQAKKLKGFFKYSALKAAQRELKNFIIKTPKWQIVL